MGESNPGSPLGEDPAAGATAREHADQPPTFRLDEGDARLSRWRIVFPVISVVLGMVGMGFWAAFILFADMPEKERGYPLPDAPEIIAVWRTTQASLLIALGVLLVAGSAMLLRRVALGATLCLAWSVLRLAIVGANIAVGLNAFDAQVAWRMESAQADRTGRLAQGFDESQLLPLPTETATRGAIRSELTSISIASATWPCVMAIVLTRRHVRAEVRGWRRRD